MNILYINIKPPTLMSRRLFHFCDYETQSYILFLFLIVFIFGIFCYLTLGNMGKTIMLIVL